MFCLRSWIPILFFLRTNASPVYLFLFISATYFLNRPCVYCSLLLAILVVALFDFSTPWFESSISSDTSGAILNTTTPLQGTIVETASIFASAATSAAQAMIKEAVNGIRNRDSSAPQITGTATQEWVKNLFSKKEWRVPCLDVLVRL
ncbi:hypothetical protein GQ43DRAFT_454529 [Delitschia confertaspora ATCC 74209]|uniref:Uncharacterized protein n=1 Tax=Delitschia confertaspora ATCC 74209 TaxID=1513339 RepID=A0A9P4JQF7_9PLEO|nr:hypothetical protein GQ43DRAFT_454529 [Delitschia confertaspora ATCC 74209]